MGHLRQITLSSIAPIQPSSLSGVAVGASEIDLAWIDNSNNEDAFQIYKDGSIIANVAAGSTSYNVTGLDPITPYSFAVRAVRYAASSNATANVTSGGYVEGYPGNPNAAAEANVAAQWLCDEASSNIVDEVSSITLAPIGTPTYSVTASGAFTPLAPGVTVSTGNYFRTNTAQATMNFGTGNFTIEAWIKKNGGAGNDYLFSTQDSVNTRGYAVAFLNATTEVALNLQAEDDTFTQHKWTVASFADNNVHKIRFVGTRASSVELFFDGVSQGTSSLAAQVGKTINANACWVGSLSYSAADTFAGTIYELRVSLNVTNNSGGPGGG